MITLKEARRRESLARWRSHLHSARAHIYSLRLVRLEGTADHPVTDGCGATLELHYRYLIMSSREMAKSALDMSRYPGWSL